MKCAMEKEKPMHLHHIFDIILLFSWPFPVSDHHLFSIQEIFTSCSHYLEVGCDRPEGRKKGCMFWPCVSKAIGNGRA